MTTSLMLECLFNVTVCTLNLNYLKDSFTQQPLNPDFDWIRLKFSYLGFFGVTFLNSGLQVHNKTPNCIFLYYEPIFKSVTRLRVGSFRMKWGLLDKSPSFQTLSSFYTRTNFHFYVKCHFEKLFIYCYMLVYTSNPYFEIRPPAKIKNKHYYLKNIKI